MKAVALATILSIAAVPAFAQSGATQSPPTPNASASAPQAATSVPPGALTANPAAPSNPHVSGPVGSTGATTPPPGPSGAPMQATVPTPAR